MAWLTQKDGGLLATCRLLQWKWFFPLTLLWTALAGALLVQTASGPGDSLVGRHEYWIRALAFSPDGTRIAAAGGLVGRRHELVAWELATGRRQTLLIGEGPSIEAICFSPDGRWLGLMQRDRTVRLLNADTGSEEARFDNSCCWQDCLGFSADSRQLVIPNGDGSLSLWDIPGRRLQRRPAPASQRGMVYASLPQGLLFNDAEQADVYVLAAAGLQRRGCFHLPAGIIWSAAAISPDQTRAAVATADGYIFFFDLRNGRASTGQQQPPERINCLAFSPDGERLVSGSQDHTVKLWDTATGRKLAELGEHDAAVFAVAFAPDGRRVASGGFDKTIRVWNVEEHSIIAAERPAQGSPGGSSRDLPGFSIGSKRATRTPRSNFCPWFTTSCGSSPLTG